MTIYPHRNPIRPATLSDDSIAEGFNEICKGKYFFHNDCWYIRMLDGTYCSANTEVFLLATQYITLKEDVGFNAMMHDSKRADYNGFINFLRKHSHPRYADELLSITGRKNPASFNSYIAPNIIRKEVDILACKLVHRHAGEMNYIYDSQGDLNVFMLLDILDVILSGKVEFCADADRFLSLIRDLAARVLTVIKSNENFTMSNIHNYSTLRSDEHSNAGDTAEFTSVVEDSFIYSDTFGWILQTGGDSYKKANTDILIFACEFAERMKTQLTVESNQSYDTARLQAMIDGARSMLKTDNDTERELINVGVDQSKADLLATSLLERNASNMYAVTVEHEDISVDALLELLDLLPDEEERSADAGELLSLVQDFAEEAQFCLECIYG